MIICKSLIDMGDGTYDVELFSDTRAEVQDQVANVKGLPNGSKLALGSIVQTADGNFAYRKSDGTWSWV